jgi:hypothetical protein
VDRAPRPPSGSEPSPALRAAAELRGWLDSGERIVVLLAPRGAARRRVLAELAAQLEGRFVATPWSASDPRGVAARPSTVDELRGGRLRLLLVVEEGERLGAEGARVLRALAHDAAGGRCAAVALAAEDAGAVLGGLGPGLEVVVLRGERRARAGRWLRVGAAGAAGLLASLSLGIGLALLLPRFAAGPPAPASLEPAAPTAVAAPPVAASPPPASAETPRRAALPPVAAPREEAAPPASPPRRAPRAEPGARAPAPRPSSGERPAPVARPSPLTRPVAATPESVAAPEPRPARAADGWLVVNAIPRARIAVDGAAIGETPIVRHPIAGGRHRVSAIFDDGREDARTVEVTGRELYLMFDGRRAGAAGR